MHFFKNLFPIAFSLALFVASCSDADYMPKPPGYFRIDLPEVAYHRFDTTFPYAFDYAAAARITFDEYTRQAPYWLNIYYPDFKATIHLSYKNLHDHNLYVLQEDARNFVFRHAQKAFGIKESVVMLPERDVFGMVYFIDGKDAASPFQFYVTDSVRHFIRGALYFNVRPNNDSLQPVIDFIVNDIDHKLSTLTWD